MSRNLDWRVEAMVPVLSEPLQRELQAILDLQLADNCKAWELRRRRQLAAAGAGRRASRAGRASRR